MTIQQFKIAFPSAQIKKESHEGEDETIGIIMRDGMISAKATFYSGEIYALSLYDMSYKLSGTSVRATFRELRSRAKIASIYYAPDGEEAGITIRLKDWPNLTVNIELTGTLKSMLTKFAYDEVPIEKLPEWAKIGSYFLRQSIGPK